MGAVSAKTKNKINISVVLIYAVLILGILITVFPFIWMLLTSLKTQGEAVRVPPSVFPAKAMFENYTNVFEKVPYGKMYMNTIISAVVTVTGQVLLCSMAAYAFARIEFPFRNIIFTLLLAILMVPGSFFILPQYLIYSENGAVKYDTCPFYAKSVQCIWDISAEAVFYVASG